MTACLQLLTINNFAYINNLLLNIQAFYGTSSCFFVHINYLKTSIQCQEWEQFTNKSLRINYSITVRVQTVLLIFAFL